MQFTTLGLPAVVRIDLDLKTDDRGFFARLFCQEELKENGINFAVAQCNNTLTRHSGTVRGMHFQRPPYAEMKLVRCVRGAVFDVAIDLRDGSPTFGEYCSVELTSSNRSMILIPAGFAHGFQTLEDDTELIYLHSEIYSRELEGGVSPLDGPLAIAWPQTISEISSRDQSLPPLSLVKPILL